MDNTWQNLYYDLKADSHREHNSYQKEIDAATKQAAEWETRYNAVHNRTKELHRKAYPERYRLSSGAELVSGWRNRAPHIGTGAGASSSDLPWNDNDKNKFQKPKFKGRR